MFHKKKSLKLRLITLLFFSLISAVSFAQGPQGPNEFWSKVRYGGGIGLGFGSNNFSITLAPSAIYQASPKFATGISLNFSYSDFQSSKFSAIGGSLMSFYNPVRFIQLSAEIEQLHINEKLTLPGETLEESFWSPALFFGIGYSSRNVTFGMRYDVLHDSDKSVYTDPWVPFFRVYF
jgi:hypothetical protein